MTGLRRSVGLGLAATLAGALVGVPAARAEFGPGAEPASAVGSRLGSADSRAPSVSDDGRYVVFDTQAPELLEGLPGLTRGLVRKDLVTGAVAVVAPARASSTASISGNGRYVLFETTAGLAPTDRNSALDVYVRDLDRPASDIDAYTLVSALDGGDTPAEYASGGSRVGPAGAGLSDDGRTAVFFTNGASNLPSGGAVTTPARQVFVRRLDTHATLRMTRALGDGAPVDEPTTLDALNPVLSGDGSAVIWLDGNSVAQVPTLPGEPNPPGAFLWRRVDGGATRRVSGATDLEDPTCDPTTPFVAKDDLTGPCYGPFLRADATDRDEGRVSAPPSISDDGTRVLFLSGARRRPYDEPTSRPTGSLYLADMAASLPRKRAVPRVISMTGGKSITSAVLSGDGRYALLAADSPGFDGPRVIGTLPSAPGTTDLWAADLAAGTVQRATVAAAGGDYHGPLRDPETPGLFVDPAPASLAVDDDAHTLAFAAADGNLFIGDANGATDVQVIRGATGAATPTGAVTALPVPGDPAPVSALSLPPLPAPRAVHPVIGYPTVGRDGVARLTVRVPAAGALAGEATTRSGGRTARVARARRTVKGASTITLRFDPSKTIKKRLRARAVKATIAVRYAPAAAAATTVKRTVTYPRRRPAR